ncbi:hypothetical protein Tco_0862331 [Tanacetum coccineum]
MFLRLSHSRLSLPSLAEQKSHEELEATQNVEKVKEHLIAQEIEKLVEGSENVEETIEVTSSPLRNDDDQVDPSTRLEPRSDKESPKVEKIADISLPVNLIKEEEESIEDDYEFKRREKGKYVEEIRNTPSPTKIRSPRIPTNLVSSDTEKLQELTEADILPSSSTPSSSSPKSKLSTTNRLLSLFKAKPGHFRYILMKALPKLVDDRIKEHTNLHSEISSQVNEAIANYIPSQIDSSVRRYMSSYILHVHPTKDTIPFAQEQQYQLYLTMKDDPDQDDPHDDVHPEGENSAKKQKTSEYGMFETGGSSSTQDYESESGPSTSGNQEQSNDFDYRTDSYAIDDDVLLNEKASQELMDEISQTVDEVKLRKESRKEIIVPQYQPKPTLVVQSCQRDLKAPGLPLVNQDLLYLKKGNSGPDKIVLSLHKFPAIIFPDDDIEERTSRWVKKCVKKFNPYARYVIDQIIKTYWELGHENKFIIKIFARRENGSIVSITEPDYKNLNKNDIEDMYLLIVNHKVDDYAETGLFYQQQVNLTARTITFLDIIYENNKKEKRVTTHQEVHKFCDATLKRVLEGLKSYNNDVKYGYVTYNLSKEDVKYL